MVKHYRRTTQTRPYDDVTFCGICGVEVFVIRKPDALAFVDHLTMLAREEVACKEHLAKHHRFRYALWRRVHWKWLVRGL